jgi:hypothetical protein
VVYWNIQNNFITYKFHSGRVNHHQIQWVSFFGEILGEVVYQNPVVFVLIILSFIYLIRNKKIFSPLINSWLLCMSLPMIGLFWGISLFNPTLPHWSGPAYIPLFFISAGFLEHRSERNTPGLLKFAGFFLIGVVIIATAFIRLAPFNIGSQDKENYGEYCPTLDLSGWKEFSRQFAQLAEQDVSSGKMKTGSPILINKWFPGGHLEYYTARASGRQVIGIGNLEDLHKFAWLNKIIPPLQLTGDAYCIVPSNMPADPWKLYGAYFACIEGPVIINQIRSGKIVRYFYVYRMKYCKKIPQPVLP